MRVGVVLPQTEMGPDPAPIRDFAQGIEQLGYDHLQSLDHVLGANAGSRPGWSGPYDHNDLIHETFVLFAYLAGVTERVELVSAVIILPQRQTALVAKQAAEIDVLSGGRMRLGVGIGWNDVEYGALGEDFHNRGRRSEEQIEVMRLLWTNELVTYNGRWHRITDAWGSIPCPFVVRFPCGSEEARTRCSGASHASATAGFPRSNRTPMVGPASRRCSTRSRSRPPRQDLGCSACTAHTGHYQSTQRPSFQWAHHSQRSFPTPCTFCATGRRAEGTGNRRPSPDNGQDQAAKEASPRPPLEKKATDIIIEHTD